MTREYYTLGVMAGFFQAHRLCRKPPANFTAHGCGGGPKTFDFAEIGGQNGAGRQGISDLILPVEESAPGRRPAQKVGDSDRV